MKKTALILGVDTPRLEALSDVLESEYDATDRFPSHPLGREDVVIVHPGPPDEASFQRSRDAIRRRVGSEARLIFLTGSGEQGRITLRGEERGDVPILRLDGFKESISSVLKLEVDGTSGLVPDESQD